MTESALIAALRALASAARARAIAGRGLIACVIVRGSPGRCLMEPTPRQRWEALKESGGYTVAEIDAIDRDTPWAHTEPAWWLEMMDARRALEVSRD